MTKKDRIDDDHDWADLARRLKGPLIRPHDDSYDEAREIWNARLARRPAAIARCTASADVAAAVDFAAKRNLLVAVRGGGHDYAGNSVCDDGLVIDLSPMQVVSIDADARRARVQAGVRWADVDAKTQTVGLAATGGTVSSVGVAGFTLGGGFGHLSRQHGLAIDNLLSAEVVTTDGEVVLASERENADLFWALRGGGGNFGVVTSFEFQLHEMGSDVLAGQVIYPIEAAPEVLAAYRDFALTAPDELTCYAFMIRIPPIPAFAEEHHGRVAIDLVIVHNGDHEEGLRLIDPLRSLGTPILDAVGPQPFSAVQQTFDAGVPKGLRWYSRSHNLDGLSNAAIETITGYARELAGPYTMAYLSPGGGAISRVEPAATAYPHRAAAFGLHVLAGWSEPEDDDANIAWTRAFHGAMAEHANGGVYVNLLAEDEPNRVRDAYGASYERLCAVKRAWDPGNLLRRNHNIDLS